MSMIEWTPDEVRVVLESLIIRLADKDPTLKVEKMHGEIKIKNQKFDESRIHVTLLKKDNIVTIYLGEHIGSYHLSDFPWKDREVKKAYKMLLDFCGTDDDKVSNMDIITKCFPEAVSREFETQVLEKK